MTDSRNVLKAVKKTLTIKNNSIMEFTYSFTLNSRPTFFGTIKLPLRNNMVVFGQFRPDEILNKNFHHPAVTGMVHYEAADEFRNDCITIINRVNATISSSDIQGCFEDALKYIVVNHIRRCGRIFINDLMAYLDALSEILLAMGYDKKYLREQYSVILFVMVNDYSSYVLEAFNTFDGKHIPFINSPRYDNLVNHVTQIIRK